ncbi:hypothetical protein GJ744_003926 [Endocarpon pusillum]|uniref:BRCT domain-containing protein n=1 Tax=Endocarpon pusillum TaxID=364733 RepID=A0A8H7AA10_9EURO|nr:hypothetical protein GJ744_003926 [Endocarpon pusillum]
MPAQSSNRRTISAKAPPKLSKKQSSKKLIQLQPDDAQIFRGLVFYFFPNNDIAAPRRKRIEKAQEYGALWAREWSADVTHVIVDANLRMSDVEKVIGSDQLKPRHVIVNEKYPPDCIEYQVLLPTHLLKFQLDQVFHDRPRRGPEAEGQQPREKSPKPASESFNRSKISATAGAASKPDNEHEEPAVVTHEPASFAAVEGFGPSITMKNGKDADDELDRIVAEVQATADLSWKMTAWNHLPPQLPPIRKMVSRQECKKRNTRG